MIESTPLPSDPKAGNPQWTVVTEPSLEPISVDEVKTFGRIDGSSEDTLLEGFITAVRKATEDYLGRSLVTRPMKVYLDYWPGTEVELPRPPLYSITKVVIIDEDDTETEYDSDSYFTVNVAIPGKIVIKNGATHPVNTDRYTAGYAIEYYAGYNDPAETDEDVIRATIPAPIREAMKLWVMQVYENRELSPEPPPEAKVILSMFRVWHY